MRAAVPGRPRLVTVQTNGGTRELSHSHTQTAGMEHKKRLSLALVLEDQDDDNPDYEYSLFNYKPRFCDMQSPQSSSVTRTELRSRSTSYTSLSSDFVTELGRDYLTL